MLLITFALLPEVLYSWQTSVLPFGGGVFDVFNGPQLGAED